MIAALIAVLSATFVLSVVIVGLVRRYALEKKMLDIPNQRSSHTLPTPRGGGVAIAVSFIAALCALFFSGLLDAVVTSALAVAGSLIAIIGYVDDWRRLSATTRLATHLIAAVFAVLLLGSFPRQELAMWGMGQSVVASGFSVLAIAWCTNLFNFMDGIDGIAASETIFVTVAGASLNCLDGGDPGMSAAMLCLAAASLGFLMWNWPPARIFMGDVGSGFLGFMVMVLAMATSQRGNVPIEVWPILGGVFFVDATTTLVRRILRGDRWSEPHRMHGYQYLSRRLASHKRVTLGVTAINVFWLVPWACLANHFHSAARICVGCALLPLVFLALLSHSGSREQ